MDSDLLLELQLGKSYDAETLRNYYQLGKKLLYLDYYIKQKLDQEGYTYTVSYPGNNKYGIFTITGVPQPLRQVYNYIKQMLRLKFYSEEYLSKWLTFLSAYFFDEELHMPVSKYEQNDYLFEKYGVKINRSTYVKWHNQVDSLDPLARQQLKAVVLRGIRIKAENQKEHDTNEQSQ